LFAGCPSLDLVTNLVGERLDLDRCAVNRQARLDQVARALERDELLVREARLAVDEPQLRHALTVARSREACPVRGDSTYPRGMKRIARSGLESAVTPPPGRWE
jgi:hypothetical protein